MCKSKPLHLKYKKFTAELLNKTPYELQVIYFLHNYLLFYFQLLKETSQNYLKIIL